MEWKISQPNPASTYKIPYRDLSEDAKDADRMVVRAILAAVGKEPPAEEDVLIRERYGPCTCPHGHEQRRCPDIMFEDGVAYCAIQSLESPAELDEEMYEALVGKPPAEEPEKSCDACFFRHARGAIGGTCDACDKGSSWAPALEPPAEEPKQEAIDNDDR
jgi:hypothetical protein